MTAPSIALVFNPEVELVDSASACELRPLPGLAVQNEPALRRAHHPIALVASSAHGGEWPTYFTDQIQPGGVFALVGLDIQNLLAHIGYPGVARRDIAITMSGSKGLNNFHLGGQGGWSHTIRRPGIHNRADPPTLGGSRLAT